MKPFDLEAAKAGAKLVTRDGREVIHFHHVDTDKSALNCVVQYADKDCACWIQANGFVCSPDEPRDGDLLMAPVERTVYVNLWPGELQGTGGGKAAYHYDTYEAARDAARGAASVKPVAVGVHVTITE